jgi:hypothetical protein
LGQEKMSQTWDQESDFGGPLGPHSCFQCYQMQGLDLVHGSWAEMEETPNRACANIWLGIT